VLVVQGGINDVVQRRPVEEAADNLGAMVDRGRAAGLAIAVTDVLPWNNGDERASEAIANLNMLIRELAARTDATLFPFHDALADPADPRRMRDGLTDDGDHPSIEGHRLLGQRAFRLPPLDV
jgi:lysophospholipase L1-like esterase